MSTVGRVIGGVLGSLLIAGVVGGILAYCSAQESEKRLEELFSSAEEAYQSQAVRQAQIDSLYGVCSDAWTEETAKNAAESASTIIPLKDVDAAARELGVHYGVLCTDGNTSAFCEAQAETLVKQATEKLDTADVEEGCLQSVGTFVTSQGSDLQVGDCVVVTIAIGSAVAVDCSEPHDGKVTALFQIEGAEFPGEEAVLREVEQGCSDSPTFLYPTKATWNLQRDREVVCIIDVAFDLEVGDCLIYAETLQRVSCSKPHDAEVIDAFDMPGTTYPGDNAVGEYGQQNCPVDTDQYLFPVEETWAIGDRLIVCLDE